MTAVTFDTLQFVETLKDSGFDETQAKGLAVAFRQVQATQGEELAHKQELKALESQLTTKADMARVEAQLNEIKRDIKELETKLDTRATAHELKLAGELAPIKWMLAVIVAGIVSLILKSFFPGV